MNKFVILMTTLGLVLAAPAWAHKDRDRDHGESRPIQERRALKPDARVVVRTVEGSIEVEAWSKNELELTGDTALLTARMTERNGDSNTSAAQHVSRVSQIWVRRNGRWRVADVRIMGEGRLNQIVR